MTLKQRARLMICVHSHLVSFQFPEQFQYGEDVETLLGLKVISVIIVCVNYGGIVLSFRKEEIIACSYKRNHVVKKPKWFSSLKNFTHHSCILLLSSEYILFLTRNTY